MDTHRKAVEAAIASGKSVLTDADAPLIELARSLAAQVDATGPDGPGTRLAATYLTTLRSLRSRIGGVATPGRRGTLAVLQHKAKGQAS